MMANISFVEMINELGPCNIPLDDYWNITSQAYQRTNVHEFHLWRGIFLGCKVGNCTHVQLSVSS